jgi:capsule polysaccharide modification protein KpsS
MPQLTVKDAVAKAKDAIRQLYDDSPLKDLALEEIELVTDGGRHRWAVTLGFFRPKSITLKHGAVGSIFHQPTQIENRDYKTIYIDADSGDFVKMEIRPVP